MCLPGSRPAPRSSSWTVGVTPPSAAGAGVVATWTIRWGASSSQVSVRWTLYPTQVVVPFLPYRASTSCGELEEQSCRRDTIPIGPPAHLPGVDGELLDPHPAERLDGGHLPEPRRRAGAIGRRQQRVAVGADLAGIRLSLPRCGWEPGFVGAPAVTLDPVGRAVLADLVRSDDRQGIQSVAQCLDRAAEPVGRADACQHVGRVGALPAPGLEQSQGLAPSQQLLQQ